MSKKLQLTITTPCHENWDAMTPVDQGKFCGSCQKQVLDFSNMSDRQVAEFFKKPSTGSVCGRFMTDQLERDIEIPRKRIPFIKYFFQIALPAFLFSIKASASKTQGKIKVATVTKDTATRPAYNDVITLGRVSRPAIIKGDTGIVMQAKAEPVKPLKGYTIVSVDTAIVPVCSKEKMGEVSMPFQDKNEIEGFVVNETDQPVPFASIQTDKRGEGLTADENGHFKISNNWLKDGRSLFFSSVGFEKKKIIAGQEVYEGDKLYVHLSPKKAMEEVVLTSFVTYRKGMVMGAYTRVTKSYATVPQPVPDNKLTVYPNPAAKGATITLNFKTLETGYYQLMIVNLAGQTVQQKDVWVDDEARLLTIEAPKVSAGNYFIILVNKKTGKKITEKIIVQ